MSVSAKDLLEIAVVAKLFGDDNKSKALPASPLTDNTAQNMAKQGDLSSIWSVLNESKQNPEKAAQINNNVIENDLKQYVDRQLNDVKKVVVDAIKNEQVAFKKQVMADVENQISNKLKVLKSNTSPIDTDEVLQSLKETIQKNVKKLHKDIENYVQDMINNHDRDLENNLTAEINQRFKQMQAKLDSQIEDNIQISDIKPDKSVLSQITGENDVTRNVIGTVPDEEYNARDMQEDTSMAVNAEKKEQKKVVDKKDATMPDKKDIEDAEFKGVDPASVSKIIGDGTDQVVDAVKDKTKEHQVAEKSAEKQDVKPSKSKESNKVDDDDPFVAPSVSFDKAVDMNDDHASNTHSKTMFDDAEEVENEEDAPENETDIEQNDNTTDVFDF